MLGCSQCSRFLDSACEYTLSLISQGLDQTARPSCRDTGVQAGVGSDRQAQALGKGDHQRPGHREKMWKALENYGNHLADLQDHAKPC